MTTQSTTASAASTRARASCGTSGRSGPLFNRRTEASLFTPTISDAPSFRAASSSVTCPTCNRSNTPFVKATRPPSPRRQRAAPSQERTFPSVDNGDPGLEGLVSRWVERERVIEERQLHPLRVVSLDVDLPRIAGSGNHQSVGRVGRKPDVLDRGFEPPPNRPIVDCRGEMCLGVHLIHQAVIPEVDLADVDPIVEGRDEDQERHQAAEGRGTPSGLRPLGPSGHHCDWAPSTISVTSLSSACFRPSASAGGW